MTDVVIAAEKLSKVYRLGRAAERSDSIVGAMASALKAPFRNFRDLRGLDVARQANGHGREDPDILWALRDVSFEIGRGEAIGIVGHNGAGKSTLLKILSRVAEPSSGRVRIRGRMSSLLEVGTGFHPELSGRENVYLNGTILGMSKQEVDRKFDEIVGFAGVDRFLDTPVKRYSSGMKVRLGFAVAAYLEPNVLIIDEVLAVGDMNFQAKCFNRIGELRRRGTTILLVSHNSHQIAGISDRVLVMDRGQVAMFGEPEPALALYKEIMARAAESAPRGASQEEAAAGSGRIRFESVRLISDEGELVESVRSTDPVTLEIRYDAGIDCPDAELDVVAYGNSDAMMLQVTNRAVNQRLAITQGHGTLRVRWDGGLFVNNQRLFFTAALWSTGRTELFDWRRGMLLKVEGNAMSAGVIWSGCEFLVDAVEAAEVIGR